MGRHAAVWGKVAIAATARAADLATTVAFDPQLSGEQNLLHKFGGAELATIVYVNVAFLALLLLLLYRGRLARHRVVGPSPEMRFGEFLSHHVLEGHAPWYHIIWRRPRGARGKWLLGRFAFTASLSISAAAVLGNVLSYTVPPFAAFWALVAGTPLGLFAVLAVAVAIGSVAWLVTEWGLYASPKWKRAFS